MDAGALCVDEGKYVWSH